MDYIIAGNYLDPTGQPVIATQLPPPDAPNIIGSATAWVGRWIKACADVTLFAHDSGGIQWDHGRIRHVLRPGEWVVWTSSEYRTVPDAEFAAYDAVPVRMSTEHEQGEQGEGRG